MASTTFDNEELGLYLKTYSCFLCWSGLFTYIPTHLET